MSDSDAMAKVLFRVPEDDGTSRVETLWAVSLDEDRYRLDNSPFYAYSVSLGDIVYAPISVEESRPTFLKVIEKSGHRTIRVIFDDKVEPGSTSQAQLDVLVAMGCTYEGANRRYICINIPPRVSLDAVRDFMIERELEFEHADPSYEELFPEDSKP